MTGLRAHGIPLDGIEAVVHEPISVSRTDSVAVRELLTQRRQLPVAINKASSRESVIENAQYDPHCLRLKLGRSQTDKEILCICGVDQIHGALEIVDTGALVCDD